MNSKSLSVISNLALVLVLGFMGGSCSESKSSHANAVNTSTREGNRAQNLVRSAFYAKAEAGNWYLIGSTIFQKIKKGFRKDVVPKPNVDLSKKASIFGGHHFSSLNISTDKKYIMGMSKPINAPVQTSAHLMILDQNLQTIYEDAAITFVGNKGKNTLSGLCWSPDQQYISYAQNSNIWLIDIRAKKRVSIANDHQRDLTFTAPSWSPDSKQLVYENQQKKVVIINIGTKQKLTLTDGRFPKWSPDGKKIVFRKDDGHVYLYTFASGKEYDVFRLRIHFPEYLWTPDSGYIFVAQKVYNSFKSNYYVYSLDDKMLIDLRHKFEKLDDHLITSLPSWIQTRLVEIETR